MKKIILISLVFLSFVKENESIVGEYKFSSQDYLYIEKINFFENYTFEYNLRSKFIIENLNGYYSVFKDTIILNSIPQKNRIIVTEKRKKGNNNFFVVTDKDSDPIFYHLHIIYEDNSVTELRDQFLSTKIKKRDVPIKGFYLVTTRGLKSPIYYKKGSAANQFTILLETKRVFEAEKWIYKNGEINPIGLDGDYQEYNLKK